MTEETPKLFNFFLVAGNILFSFETTEGVQVQTVTQSAIVRADSEKFAVKQLVRAQRNLQAIFYTKIANQEEATIRDIVVTNVSHLGLMTEEEFQVLPEEVAEVAAEQTEPVVLRSEQELKDALSGTIQ